MIPHYCYCSLLFHPLEIVMHTHSSPATILFPLLDVIDVIDRATDSHVIIVACNEKGMLPFDRSLKK